MESDGILDNLEEPPAEYVQKYKELVSKRKGLRSQLSGRIKQVYEALTKVEPTKESLMDMEAYRRRIIELKQSLATVDDQVMEMVYIVEPKNGESTAASVDTYQGRAIEAIVAIDGFLAKHGQSDKKPAVQAATSAEQSFNPAAGVINPVVFQQPPIKLQKFSGDVKRFREWWELYELYVHSNVHLADVEKLRRLKEALVGQAAATIRHVTLEGRNYQAAVNRIKEAYGNIVDAESEHARTIHRLCTTRDLHRFEKYTYFVSAVSQNINELVTLGKSFDALSTAFAPIILDCLPEQLKLDFMRQFTDSKARGVVGKSKLEMLISFLENDVAIKRSLSIRNRVGTEQHRSGHQEHNAHSNANRFPRDQGRKDHQSNRVFLANMDKVDRSCVFCGDSHQSADCKKCMSIEEKKRKIMDANACFKCIARGHAAKQCKTKVKCSKCSRNHLSVMCSSTGGENKTRTVNAVGVREVSHPSGQTTTMMSIQLGTALPTGYVWAIAGSKRALCRVLFDTGAQRSFVSGSLIERLGLKAVGAESTVTSTIDGVVSELKKLEIFVINLESRFDKQGCEIECLGIGKITDGALPFVRETPDVFPIADRVQGNHSPMVELLIGADFLTSVFLNDVRTFGGIMAVKTIFGWVFSGTDRSALSANGAFASLCVLHTIQPDTVVAQPDSTALQAQSGHEPTVSDVLLAEEQVGVVCAHVAAEPEQTVESDLKFLWDSELLGLGNADEESEYLAELNEFFERSIERQSDGRYCLSLPFKENVRSLSSNEAMARKRLSVLLAKAKKDKKLLKAIDEEIMSYIEQGFAEEAEPVAEGQLVHYLPLQAVVKLKKGPLVGSDGAISMEESMKVRVVKDGSARAKDGISLNEVLHQGPNLLPCLIKVLTRFRESKIALATDVEKAFLQFRIKPEHRSFLRFLWPVGISKDEKATVKELWSTRLDFGLICSPWLHQAGLRHHLRAESELHPERAEFLNEIAETFYMDDVFAGTQTLESAKWAVDTLISSFSSGCFPLNKWATNSADLGQFIKERSPQGTSVTCGDRAFKLLGLKWDQASDKLGVFVSKAVATLHGAQPSKRNLLKALAQVFDPLGVTAPITINAKVLLQRLWQQKFDWDDLLSGKNEQLFVDFKESLSTAEALCVDREIVFGTYNELYVFCDASEAAYGCVAYLRAVDDGGEVKVSFVMAKARVAPVKGSHTIHRLELLGALVASRIAKKLKESLRGKIDRTRFFCDNAAVLGWIREESPGKWKVFVANRIREIHRISRPDDWFYVQSADNPADILSRGTALDEETKRHWEFGPRWLREDGQPIQRHALNEIPVPDAECMVERRAEQVFAASVQKPSELVVDAARFSDWRRAVRATAWVLRYVRNLKMLSEARKQQRETARDDFGASVISSEEYANAELSLLRQIQAKHFASERRMIVSKLPKSSRLFQYNAFMDEDRLLRCKSRLQKAAELSFDEKNPIILPAEEPLVRLIAKEVHGKKCLHSGGAASVLHHLRQRFLVMGARKLAKRVVKGCMVCVKFNAKPGAEPVPPLPAFRVDRAPPFSICGIDFAGPIYVKDEKAHDKRKAYIALFVCAVTRAIHLELVADMSTHEFLMDLRRFINQYRSVSKIISDNGRTFVRAAKEIKLMYSHIRSEAVRGFLAGERIVWDFITPNAPWFGGFYERIVSVVKRPLRKILGQNVLPFRTLATVLTDIAAMVNGRPLTQVSTDPNDVRALCPADLLFGYRAKLPLPDTKRNPTNVGDLNAVIFSSRWKFQQSVLNSFWKRFKSEYLEHLRSIHQNGPVDSRPLRAGDICILRDDAPSRAYWQICRVVSMFGGQRTDQRMRSCWVRLPSGQTLIRPIAHLYRLEVEGMDESDKQY